MKIWTKKDYEDIPYGSCIQEYSVANGIVSGLWCSMAGSYIVNIPVEYFNKDDLGEYRDDEKIH